MSPGYSTKIYKERKKPVFPYILISLIVLAISIFIYLNKNKREVIVSNIIHENISEPEKKISKPEKIYSGKVEEELLIVPEENITTDQNSTGVEKIARDELLTIQNRALYYTKIKNYRKAIEEYTILVEYNKRFLTIIGMCYYWMSKNEKALEFLKNADDLGNYPFRTKKYIAFCYYRLNDLSNSLEFAENALKYGKDHELKSLLGKLKREENVMKDYKDLGTENFLVQFSREEHDQIRSIVSDYLKEAYREIGKKLDYFPNRQFVVILYNERDFFDVTRAPGWAGGLYDGKIRLPVRGLTGSDSILRKVIFHEYTHALISEITQKCPLWINEGLAEYFSSENENVHVQNPIPLKYLAKRFPSGNIGHISLAYRTSHFAVKYLIEKYGMYSIMELLENFGEGMDVNSAFESVLFITYDDFVEKWEKQQ